MRLVGAIYWQVEGWLPWAGVAIAIIACAAVVARTYRDQAVPPLWRWGMAALKLAAMVAVCLAFLRPVVVRPERRGEAGGVAVLIDVSKSMSAVDAATPPPEWVELADALGKLPPGARGREFDGIRKRLETLARDAEAGQKLAGELEYARLAGRDADALRQKFNALSARAGEQAKSIAAVARQTEATKPAAAALDGVTGWSPELRTKVAQATAAVASARRTADAQLYERNADVRTACDALAKQSRLELARAALTGDGGFVARLPDDVPIYAFTFADRVQPVALRQSGKGAWPAGVEATGNGSDLAAAVRDVTARLAGRRVQATIVVTDGRQVPGETALPPNLAAAGVPVYPVASAGDPRDLAVQSVTMPESAYPGETITANVTLRSWGLRGMPADVQVRMGDQAAEQIVALDPQTQTARVRVQLRVPAPRPTASTEPADRDGRLETVTVSVAPAPGEASTANNSIERLLKILPGPLRVAAIAGTPGWDFQYVRNALARSPWAVLTEAVLPPGSRLAMSSDEILRQNVLLLFDVGAASLDAAQWDAAGRLASEKGASVVLVAGDAHLPVEYAADPTLADLLPFRAAGASLGTTPVWRSWAGEEAYFRLRPTPDGQQTDALRLEDEFRSGGVAGNVASQWARLPAVFRYLQMPELKPNARALLTERESGAPVLTESRIGAGRAFFFGVNETWRWRYKAGEAEQDRFWLQLVRYAADAPYLRNGHGWALDVERPQVGPGEPVHVRAKRVGVAPATRPDEPRVEIVAGGRVTASQTLTSTGTGGRYEAVVRDLPAGEYSVRLASAGEDLSVPVRVADASAAEWADLSPDDTLLRRIAETTGGRVLALAELPDLPAILSRQRDERPRVVETPLWYSPWLFAFVLGCLGAEWGLRKRLGLA